MNTAEAIKAAREQAGLTQEALAERLDVNRQAVSKWEMGLSIPSPENLQILVHVLNVDFSEPGEPPQELPPSPGHAGRPPRWCWAGCAFYWLSCF